MDIIYAVSEPNKGKIFKIYNKLNYNHSPQISVLIDTPFPGCFYTASAYLSFPNL